MQRPIIVIDREKCNGCGQCVNACAEGALQLVDGKAMLVNEEHCDGLGACIGDCPTGALRLEYRDAPAFNMPPKSTSAPSASGDASRPPPQACPGMRVINADKLTSASSHNAAVPAAGASSVPQAIPSELRQWPALLHLVPPAAPFLKERELLLLSVCAPVASADVHWRFIRGRAVLTACPKLSTPAEITSKLAQVFTAARPTRVLIARMEVPCCRALAVAARAAAEQAGMPDLPFDEVVVGLNGDMQ